MKLWRLAGALVFFLTLCLLPFPHLNAEGIITYIENFADNGNGWWEVDKDNVKSETKNNRHYLEQKNQGVMSFSWSKMPINQNSDFEVEISARFLNGLDSFGYGFFWGLPEGNNPGFCAHMVSSNGRQCVMKFANSEVSYMLPWKESSAVYKGQSTNILTINKSGNTFSFFVNNYLIGSGPVEPFLGDKFGFVVGGQLAAEFYHLSISTPSDQVPSSWFVVHVGNFNTRILWDSPKDVSRFKAQIYKHSDTVAKSYVQGKNVAIHARLRSPQNVDTSYGGIYLQAQSGELLRLTRLQTPKGVAVKFSLSHQDKDLGSKEILLPSQEVAMKLERAGDAFRGEVVAEGKMMTVGSLKWPNVSEEQEGGAIVGYRDSTQNGPQSLTYEFSSFSVSSPSSAVQVPAQQQGHQRAQEPAPAIPVLNIASTAWLCKDDDDGQTHDLVFDGSGNFERRYHVSGVIASGPWKQSGNSLYLVVGQRAVEHRATIRGVNMQGRGRTIQGIEWTWSCSKRN